MKFSALLVILLIFGVLSQSDSSQPQNSATSSSPQSLTISPSFTSQPFINTFPGSSGNTGGSNSVDIDESQANNMINTFFGGNSAAVRAIQSTSTPAPTNAPAGAQLSRTAPSASLTSSASLVGGGYVRWGHWVRILRCNWQWNGGFCCNWVWVWRYW